MTADTFEALAILYRTGARRTLAAEAGAKEAVIMHNMPIIDHGAPTVSTMSHEPSTIDQPKSDWMKPKIFKGGTPTQ